ncbi:hypothetical protein O3G_MSEX001596 [Manduca sexta]|uniref:Cytochrome b561 domain-containing protein n=1 Tax=Manduca sexta TaxID=7130 RepID=A0A921YLU6_MANSE|nr:hypothetical protein O3G_MSEX001596 [Manduca sexta]
MASTSTDIENSRSAPTTQLDANEYKLKIFQSTLNCIVHITIGATVFVTLMFAFRNGLPIGTTSLHVTLCVIGYQLLMAQATLALSPSNGWTAHLKLVHKRRIHWVLQIVGSGMAIAGTLIMSLEKTVNWNTLHGKFGKLSLLLEHGRHTAACASRTIPAEMPKSCYITCKINIFDL